VLASTFDALRFVTLPGTGISAAPSDFLRLLAVPVFGWAAYRDIETRRVATRTWYPLVALALALLVWDGYAAYVGGDRLFFLQVAISVGFIVPLVTAFWYMGSFGGADAKAFYVLALLFPAYPVYYLPSTALPLEPTAVGVFSLTILSNTVVAGALYPVGVAVSNLARGRIGLPMVIGKPIPTIELTGEYGLLLETPDGFTRRGLDLDALRMYLRWRECSLADLRSDPTTHRDPESLPRVPGQVGDGNIATDGGMAAATTDPSTADYDDPWGAEAFLEDVEGAYGTTPEGLRDGLDVIASEDEVWVSPGIPFIVPTFVGLLVSLVYGDVLVSLLGALGLA
jgi:preflagellin peptidase FlaK